MRHGDSPRAQANVETQEDQGGRERQAPRRWLLTAAISTAVSLSTLPLTHETDSTWEFPCSSWTAFLPHGWVKTTINKPEMPATRPPLSIAGEGDVLLQGNVLDVMTLQSLKFTLVLRLGNMWKHQKNTDSNSSSLPLSPVCV